ncbi:uncharacterized protein LOC143525753 isoform X7 [Brachyhypopomus gauderio]|uniref:uncharacterized protein LOC143525753 isoform X7 n=1 Tax=Brachyhypopomus gauderio TaxID=698409 RepID=UPI0040419649
MCADVYVLSKFIVRVLSTSAGRVLMVFGCFVISAKVTPVTSGETVTLKCPSAFEKNDTVDVEWGRDGGFLCLREEKLNFTWSKADKELLHLHNMNMRNMSSRLRLCEPAWRYGDTLTCHASYANDSVVYSRAITLTENSNTSRMVVVISIISSLGLLLLLLLLSVAVYKYRKRRMASEAVVFNNKVYENFSFFTARPNAEPSDVSYPRGNGRSNPQRAQGTQGEESIYEN